MASRRIAELLLAHQRKMADLFHRQTPRPQVEDEQLASLQSQVMALQGQVGHLTNLLEANALQKVDLVPKSKWEEAQR